MHTNGCALKKMYGRAQIQPMMSNMKSTSSKHHFLESERRPLSSRSDRRPVLIWYVYFGGRIFGGDQAEALLHQAQGLLLQIVQLQLSRDAVHLEGGSPPPPLIKITVSVPNAEFYHGFCYGFCTVSVRFLYQGKLLQSALSRAAVR